MSFCSVPAGAKNTLLQPTLRFLYTEMIPIFLTDKGSSADEFQALLLELGFDRTLPDNTLRTRDSPQWCNKTECQYFLCKVGGKGCT